MIMITSDAMSRGLDILDLTSVVHAPFPNLVTDFLHRTGRVGRAGRAGRATVFYDASDKLAVATKKAIEKGESLETLY